MKEFFKFLLIILIMGPFCFFPGFGIAEFIGRILL